MINLREQTRALWYVELGGGDNFLAHVAETAPGRLVIEYRFRYKRDNKAFDSADERRGYTAEGPADEVMAIIESIIADMRESKLEVYELRRDGSSMAQFIEEFRKLPFVHMRAENIQ